MAASSQICSSVCSYSSIRDNCVFGAPINASSVRFPSNLGTTFASGSSLLFRKASYRVNYESNPKSVIIKCEQNTKDGNGIDVWVGRLAMIGFAAAISVEVGTGKGLLENFGLTSPLPTVALAVTALVGVLTAVFIFQSASDT